MLGPPPLTPSPGIIYPLNPSLMGSQMLPWVASQRESHKGRVSLLQESSPPKSSAGQAKGSIG